MEREPNRVLLTPGETFHPLADILSTGVSHPDLNAAGTGATRLSLTTTQINWFTDNYEIVTHYPKDATGFSATLFKNKTTGEYPLSSRSTEYQLTGKGGDYERDGVKKAGVTRRPGSGLSKSHSPTHCWVLVPASKADYHGVYHVIPFWPTSSRP